MKSMYGTVIVLCAYLLAVVPSAHAITTELTDAQIKEAVAMGEKLKLQALDYIDKQYKFGSDDLFGENGVVRTRWSKIVVLAGILAESGKSIERERIENIKTADLQIDIHIFGNSLNFANSATVELVQKDKIIRPIALSAEHANHHPDSKLANTGFQKYCATVRTFFKHAEIDPQARAELIIRHDTRTDRFNIDLSAYR